MNGSPRIRCQSAALTDEARTRTRTLSSGSDGTSTSASSSSSGEPYDTWRTAFIDIAPAGAIAVMTQPRAARTGGHVAPAGSRRSLGRTLYEQVGLEAS